MKIPLSVYDFFGYLAAGFVVVATLDYGFNDASLLLAPPKYATSVVLVFVAYIVGHAVAHLSHFTLETWFVRKRLRSPEETLFEDSATSRWRYLFPGFYSPLPKKTRDRVLTKAEAAASIRTPDRSLFFHCHPIVMREQAARERLNTFLNLYGFARNVCFASLLGAAILAIAGLWEFRPSHWAIHGEKLLVGLASLSVSVVMFYRYLKFFRLYTVEVYRTYAELTIPNEKES